MGQATPATAAAAVAILVLLLFTSSAVIEALMPVQQHIHVRSTNGYASSLFLSSQEATDVDDHSNVERYLRFSGVGRLYSSGKEAEVNSESHLSIVDKLGAATCAIVGIGGVGTWAAEAICRSGVGNIILIDMDDICISNSNRQLHATISSIGKSKVHEMESRLRDINPAVNITTIFDFVTLDNVNDILNMLPSDAICLDCIDGQREKAALIVECYEKQIPVVTCGGAAGRKDPTCIVCGDITAAVEDRLLFRCRKLLRKEYGWPKGPGQGQKNNHKVKAWNIPAVFSTEIQKSVSLQGETSSLRRCDGALGTACMVTGTYGFVAASKVIDMIVNNDDRMLPLKPER